MKGIDISNYQKGINLAQQKTNGVEVVYIKATEGLTLDDDCMMIFYNQARALNLKVSFYHFLKANDPIAEAKHFISRVKGLHVDCLYMIDGETNPVGISARIRAFSDYLASQGMPTLLYTGESFYNTEITSVARNIPLWVAAYRSIRPAVKSIAWQYSESGNLDQDIFDEGILLNKPITATVGNRQFNINMAANIQGSGLTTTSGVNICKIGTEGQSKRLEMFSMTIDGIDFDCKAYEQTVGDTATVGEGGVVGTIGIGRRIEGITITVTNIPTGYKLQYQANIQTLGKTGWINSGVYCGTKGKGLRLEEIMVQIIKA